LAEHGGCWVGVGLITSGLLFFATVAY